MIHRSHAMKKSILALSTLVTLVSCEKAEPQKASEPPPQIQPTPVTDLPKKKEPQAPADTAEDLKKLQGNLPRMDPEKAKFIATPSTPPDPKSADKPKAAETIVKAVPAAQEQPDPAKTK